MGDHAEDSKSENSAERSAKLPGAKADSKGDAAPLVETPAAPDTEAKNAADAASGAAEKGQVVSLRVVRQATQAFLSEPVTTKSQPDIEPPAKSARAWAMREEVSPVAEAVPVQPETSSAVAAQPQAAAAAAPAQTETSSEVAAPAQVAAEAVPVQPETSSAVAVQPQAAAAAAPVQPQATAPAVPAQLPTGAAPKKTRTVKPETAMPILSRSDRPKAETATTTPEKPDVEDEPPARVQASSAASRQLEVAMGAVQESMPTSQESRSDRLEALAEGLKWSPPRLPNLGILGIIGLVALTLGAMLVGFLICCSITNVQIDFSDNNADATHSRLIVSPPVIRFVPKPANPTPSQPALIQTTTAKVELQPPSNATAANQMPPSSTSTAIQSSNPPADSETGKTPPNNNHSTDNQMTEDQATAQQPQPLKAPLTLAPTAQRTAPVNSLRQRQPHQMTTQPTAPTVVRPRHAYEMKPLPPAVQRHAYRTSDKP